MNAAWGGAPLEPPYPSVLLFIKPLSKGLDVDTIPPLGRQEKCRTLRARNWTSSTAPRKSSGSSKVFCAQNTFELPDDFLGAVDEVQFLARSVRHFSCLPSGGMVSTSKPFDKGLMNSRTEGREVQGGRLPRQRSSRIHQRRLSLQ